MLRHFFAVGPALVLGVILFGALFGSRLNPANRPISREELLHRPAKPSALSRAGSLVPIIWGEAAAVFFLIDSMRRKYRGARSVAVALAVMGLLSAGMTSLIYYACWGYRPLEPATDIFGSALCTRCLQSTTDVAAPGALAMNVVVGTRYMGSADRCAQCNSVIRTLWFWFLLPLAPLGSYRVVATDTYRFVGRKTALRWSHVATVYGVALAVVVLVSAIYLTNQ